MLTNTIHNHLLVRGLVALCALGASACGEIPDAPGGYGETSGVAEAGMSSHEGGEQGGAGEHEGGDAGQSGGADDAGSYEFVEWQGATGAESAGPVPLPDPEEPALACRMVTGEIIGACDDDSVMRPDCDEVFALACENEGGALEEPSSDLLEDEYCSNQTDVLVDCDAVFKNACSGGGGVFTCYWWEGSECNDGECDFTAIPQ